MHLYWLILLCYYTPLGKVLSTEFDQEVHDFFTEERLEEMDDTIRSIREIRFYDRVYNPQEPAVEHHRRQKRSTDQLLKYLKGTVDDLLKMRQSSGSQKTDYYKKALKKIDAYVELAKKGSPHGQQNALQVMKFKECDVVMCSEKRHWYPVFHLTNRTLSCKNGNLRFDYTKN